MTEKEANEYCETVQRTIHQLVDGMPYVVKLLASVSAFKSLTETEREAALKLMNKLHHANRQTII
jgi:hypothetical protein